MVEAINILKTEPIIAEPQFFPILSINLLSLDKEQAFFFLLQDILFSLFLLFLWILFPKMDLSPFFIDSNRPDIIFFQIHVLAAVLFELYLVRVFPKFFQAYLSGSTYSISNRSWEINLSVRSWSDMHLIDKTLWFLVTYCQGLFSVMRCFLVSLGLSSCFF